ncbi:hypothetical protein G7Y89_g905 [Cudoniella acicularis]|uniref:FAD-binding PCMH-type domain-containing protein n=1 Tax=Cudoniella acicularis TaxID=354080 RepID=A0A8H4RW88_9HELO|nr:hypothetical protein G7Y89_g905 [Cudoniella acicularis]
MSSVNRQAVQQLRSSLSNTALVLTPTSAGYKGSVTPWASSAEKRAGLVVLPTTATDVAKAIQFSVQNGLELAVGGEEMTITAQGGALWADVDTTAAQFGVAAVGGTANFVGVGGLTLGGGYGYLSGAHGLVIDNLISVELVLASGEVVNASEVENKDLFWAVRGAGSSFGVATKFVFRAHEQKNLVWGGSLQFNKSQLSDVIAFANHTMEISQGEATMMVGFSTSANSKASIVAVVFYNGTEAAAKSFYAPLLNLNPSFNDTSMVPYSSVNSWHNATVSHGSRRAMKGSALLTPVNPAFVEGLFDDYETLMESIDDATKSLVLFDFFSFKKTMSVPQTATSFANRGAFINVLFAPAWESKNLDTVCQEWTLSVAAKTQAELERQKSAGTDETTQFAAGEYKNYDGFGSSSPEKLFGVNFERLVALKKHYDSENIFAKGHNLLPGTQARGNVVRSSLVPERVNAISETPGRKVATVA